MRIKKINIINFKGFQNETVQFNGNLTVIIGNNTAGKTTLLKALQVGLGAYLQCLSQLPGGTSYRRNFSSLDRFKRFSPELRDYIANEEKPKISIDAEFPVTQFTDGKTNLSFNPIHWYREFSGNYTTHTKECAGELIQAVEKMESCRNDNHLASIYPLMLAFGAKRTSDSQAKTTSKTKERDSRIEKAYKFALHDNRMDFEGAIEWLRRYDKNIKDGKEFEGTKEAFYEALQTAIPALSEIDFDNGEIEAIVSVTGRTPSRHHFSYMSDGLQSMINIVSEVAHRCIELNGFMGKDAIKMTPGVVLIDEIDLYLHPHWQKHILQDLTKAFPMIQFIVSTHSPFIVQSLQKGQLISFDKDAIISGEPFREGLEDIVSERMGLKQDIRSKRFNEMVETATRFFEATDKGQKNKNELKAQLDQIEAEFSDDPAYVAFIKTEYKARQK